MTISAIAVLSIFLGLFGVLLTIALVHVIQGIRYGGGSSSMITASTIFLSGIVVVTLATWFFLRSVDWSTPFVVRIPLLTTAEPQ
jgi:hypothetical protein